VRSAGTVLTVVCNLPASRRAGIPRHKLMLSEHRFAREAAPEEFTAALGRMIDRAKRTDAACIYVRRLGGRAAQLAAWKAM
jgi:hypothetical protein